MSTKQITIADFCAHAADEMVAVEQGEMVVELVRDWKIVAYLSPAPKPDAATGTLADWIGAGAGTVVFAPGIDPDEPAFAPGEWEDFPDDVG